MSQNKGIADKLYEGSGELGRFQSTLTLICGIILGIIIIICGVYWIVSSDDGDYLYVPGTVTVADCVENKTYDSKGNLIVKYVCNLTLDYVIDGTTHTGKLRTNNTSNYNVNDTISLAVSKADSQKIKVANTLSDMTMGAASICCAILMMCGSSLNYYMTSRFETYAAAQGASTAIGAFT
jgi:hypothetical protein